MGKIYIYKSHIQKKLEYRKNSQSSTVEKTIQLEMGKRYEQTFY